MAPARWRRGRDGLGRAVLGPAHAARPADAGASCGRIDPNSGPTAIAVGAGAIWVTDATPTRSRGSIRRVLRRRSRSARTGGDRRRRRRRVGRRRARRRRRPDRPRTSAVTTTIPVGQAPTGVAVGAGSVWVANSGDGTVTRIDPANRQGDRRRSRSAAARRRITFADGRVWVTVDGRRSRAPAGQLPAGPRASTSESTSTTWIRRSRIAPSPGSSSTRPAPSSLNYPDKPAPAGSQLVPEVAQSLPTARPTARRTRSRSARASASRRPRRASHRPDVQALDRAHPEPEDEEPWRSGYLGDIVGADAFMAGKAPHIAGIVARGNTLTIRLARRRPIFVARLRCPSSAPSRSVRRRPERRADDPVRRPLLRRLVHARPGGRARAQPELPRHRPHRLDQIELTVGRLPDSRRSPRSKPAPPTTAIDRHRSAATPPTARRPLRRRTARLRGAAGSSTSSTRRWARLLHAQHPPAAVPATCVRQAVNYAIDRRALARIGSMRSARSNRPTSSCRPAMPGFNDAHVYPLTPRPRQRQTTRRGTDGPPSSTPATVPCDRLAQIVKTILPRSGSTSRSRPSALELWYAARAGRRAVRSRLDGWLADYPDPATSSTSWTARDGALARPFNDPATSASSRSGAALRPAAATSPTASSTSISPATPRPGPLRQPGAHDFFSARIGCQVYNGFYGMDLAALCIRH